MRRQSTRFPAGKHEPVWGQLLAHRWLLMPLHMFMTKMVVIADLG